MRKFLESLAETADAPLPPWASVVESESVGCDDLLVAADAVARLDAPGNAPALNLDVARWAARVVFRACCCLADRTVDAAAVANALGQPAPPGLGATTAWSADIFLRHLPELHGLARGLAPGDPLVAAIETLGAGWPLSSVGMPVGGVEPTLPPCIAADPCLRRLYVDRVLRCGNTARIATPWVAEGVRAALGAHADLAPGAAAAIDVSREHSNVG